MEDQFHLGIKALIINSQNKILLLQVNPHKSINDSVANYWDIPGGRKKIGDNIIDTLIKEVMEETGMVISKDNLSKNLGYYLSNIRIPNKEDTQKSYGLIINVYQVQLQDYTIITLSDEHINYKWFEIDEAIEKLSHKYPKEFCEFIKNGGQY